MKRAFLHRVYLAGYTGQIMPRWMRRAFPGSELHRAWFLGFVCSVRDYPHLPCLNPLLEFLGRPILCRIPWITLLAREGRSPLVKSVS